MESKARAEGGHCGRGGGGVGARGRTCPSGRSVPHSGPAGERDVSAPPETGFVVSDSLDWPR